MATDVTATPFAEPLARRLATPPGSAVTLYWLGQAGFVIDGAGRRLVIDPYLSDSLAEKYRGRPFDHRRMMPAPVSPSGLGPVDLVMCTHQHTDHMDPPTLQAIAMANPKVRFIVPEASLEEAASRAGVPTTRLIPMDAGRTALPWPELRITATRAAHETLERDRQGRYRYLGYAIRIGDLTLYHSGDCVPFDGLISEVTAMAPSLALLPVNGRDALRRSRGVPGNFTVEEALELAVRCRIPSTIAHHFGMFDFNTVAPDAIAAAAAKVPATRLLCARTQTVYNMTPT